MKPRKAIPRSTKPIKRSRVRATGKPDKPRKPIARSPIKSRGRRHRKCYAHLRNEPFKAWAREQGCQLAGLPGHVCDGRVEFAHDKAEGNGGADLGNGAGLCGIAGHRLGRYSLHVMGPKSFDRHWGIDFTAICQALGREYTGEVFA